MPLALARMGAVLAAAAVAVAGPALTGFPSGGGSAFAKGKDDSKDDSKGGKESSGRSDDRGNGKGNNGNGRGNGGSQGGKGSSSGGGSSGGTGGLGSGAGGSGSGGAPSGGEPSLGGGSTGGGGLGKPSAGGSRGGSGGTVTRGTATRGSGIGITVTLSPRRSGSDGSTAGTRSGVRSQTRTVMVTAPAPTRNGGRTRSAQAAPGPKASGKAASSRASAPKKPAWRSVAEIQRMTSASPWPEPRPWGPHLSLAALQLRLRHAGAEPEPRPEGLAELGLALAALGIAPPSEGIGAADGASPLPEAAMGDAAMPGRIEAYRDALAAVADATEEWKRAQAALAAHDEVGPPPSADILARMDAIAMMGSLADGREAEFAVLRDAYDAALQSEAERGAGGDTAERGALLLAVAEAEADRQAARDALLLAEAEVLEGRTVPPEVLIELHRLLGAEPVRD